jgi:hypothetical protein
VVTAVISLGIAMSPSTAAVTSPPAVPAVPADAVEPRNDRGDAAEIPLPPGDAPAELAAPIPGPAGPKEPPADLQGAVDANPNRHLAQWGITVPSGGWYFVRAYCPDGWQATGGGGFNTSWGGVKMTASRPSPFQGNGWEVHVHNLSGGDTHVTAYASCVRVGAIPRYELSDSGYVPEPGKTTAPAALCTENRRVLGGGFESGSPYVQVSTTTPIWTVQPQSWGVVARNVSAEPFEVRAFAACGDSPGLLYHTAGPEVPVTNGYVRAVISCDEGTVALGGGVRTISSGAYVYLTDSYPVGDREWVIYASSPRTDQVIRPHVVCGEV